MEDKCSALALFEVLRAQITPKSISALSDAEDTKGWSGKNTALKTIKVLLSVGPAKIVYYNHRVCFVFNWSNRLFYYRPTWYRTRVFTSHWPLMRPWSLLKRPTTSSWLSLKSPTCVLSQPIRWWNVTHATESTWLAVCCSEVMWYQRMWTQPLPP